MQNFIILQKQPPKVFYKKCVLKNFAIFTGKHLCWTLFAGLQVCSFIKKNSKKLHTNLNKCQVKRSLLVGTKFNFHMLIVGWNLSWLDRAKYLLDNPGSSHHNLRWYLENWSLKPIKVKIFDVIFNGTRGINRTIIRQVYNGAAYRKTK